jgi:DNA ligase-1
MNPFWVYGIGTKAFNKNGVGENTFTDIIDVLEFLKQNPTGTDKIKFQVNAFINSQPEQHQNWYKRIILKDLRIGCTEKTVNKIWSNLVPVFDVMLAKPFDKLFNEVACEVKLDGVRVLCVKQNGITNLFTRNGKIVEGYNNIIKDINELPIGDIILDGEIISGNYTGTMNNLFNKSNNKQGILNIFDVLSVEEFYSGKSKKTYLERKNDLNEYKIMSDADNLNFIFPIATFINPTIEQLNKVTEEVVRQGYEGIMVKNVRGYYECKRSVDWQKMKPFFTEEFAIIDFESGTGKYKDILGKVIIDVNGVAVGCGSGWTDEQRKEFWNNKDKYLGKFIEVQYQEKIEKTGSLRFPTVKGFREF